MLWMLQAGGQQDRNIGRSIFPIAIHYQHGIKVGTIGDRAQPDCNRTLVAEIESEAEYLDGSDARIRWQSDTFCI